MDATTFHNTIVAEFGLQSFSTEEQTQYVDQIGEIVLQGVLIKSLSILNEDQATVLDSMIDQEKSPEEIMQYLQSAIPGFTNLITDEVTQVKKDLATGTAGMVQ
jgi:hypothetical protein